MDLKVIEMMWEAERKQAEIMVIEQIKTLRSTLDNLETKITEGRGVYASDGLQGNGGYLDSALVKLANYTKIIEEVRRATAPKE